MALLGCDSWAGAHLCVPCLWRCGGSLVPPPRLNPMQFFAAQVLWKEQTWQACKSEILESRPLCCGVFIFVIIGVMPVYLKSSLHFLHAILPQMCLCVAVREIRVCYSQFVFLYRMWEMMLLVFLNSSAGRNYHIWLWVPSSSQAWFGHLCISGLSQ